MSSGLSTDGFPDESHGHQLQEIYQQILESLLRQIASSVNGLGNLVFDGEQERDIKILIGGKEVEKNELTDAQVEKLRRAIRDPESIKNGPYQGTVEIRIDGSTVFRNEYGLVSVDELNLTQGSRQEILAPLVGEQVLYPQPTVTNQVAQVNREVGGLQAELDNSLQKQPKSEVSELQQIVTQQADKIEALEAKLSVITDSLQTIQNRSLSNWLSSTISNATEGFKQFINRWTSSANEAVKNLQQTAQPVLQALSKNREPQKQIQQQLASIDNTVQTVKIRFDDSLKDIQAKLANIQTQLNTISEQSGVQSQIKTTVENGAEQEARGQGALCRGELSPAPNLLSQAELGSQSPTDSERGFLLGGVQSPSINPPAPFLPAKEPLPEPDLAAANQQIGVIQNSELTQGEAKAQPQPQPQPQPESSAKFLQSKDVEQAVQAILKKHGITNGQNGSTYCRGSEYTLSSGLNGTRITANDDGRTIFQNSGFTDRATQADKNDLRILVERTQKNFLPSQSQSQPNVSPDLNGFNAAEIVAAAKKLLEKIPAQSSEGTRSFTTGTGYCFQKTGNIITVSDSQRGELIRSVGTGNKRQLSVSSSLTSQDTSSLEKIAGKINQDLPTKATQSQSQSETQRQVQSQNRGRR